MRTIVVAVDISPQAHATIAALHSLYLDPQPTIVLCYVLTAELDEDIPADIPSQAHNPEQQLIQAEKFLLELSQEMGETLDPSLDLTIEIELTTGDPAEEIVRFAGIYDAELIVLGSRNLKGLNRVIMGSVSTQVMESSTCSVLVVKSNDGV